MKKDTWCFHCKKFENCRSSQKINDTICSWYQSNKNYNQDLLNNQYAKGYRMAMLDISIMLKRLSDDLYEKVEIIDNTIKEQLNENY